ncbi:MutS-related protein [Niabella ginsengisoli]|uniref:DNA mismatch repair proteins mutS family domain-containing protein n=1 Tax=Niabella ginsengisoli TaxID=522298 RepID=A0ABS9SM27_9BACT|nr:hypothetical protein [Niabella ginsengisoli]MCH5599380.1 hypothetical protein [Niabella ginsengisoli]
MNNIKDLNLENEILPLFDFTINKLAKEKLYKIFQEPLSAIEDIRSRQNIIKGFITNEEVLRNYSYSKQDFYEVYKFLEEAPFKDYSKVSKFKYLFFKKEKEQLESKLIQLILLFRALDLYYIRRNETRFFPDDYKRELILLSDFFRSLNLDFYSKLENEGSFNTGHLVDFLNIISEKQSSGEFKIFYNRFLLFEVYVSISKGVLKHQFCFPSFCEEALLLEDVYHPVLKNPVKNTFSSEKNVLLLTGPNMSGKSTFLKAVGICVYLAHLGIAIPASKAEIPFFDLISVSINHQDDLLNGYSHFMNEIVRLREVVEAAANKRCFAVFDELFKGTNVEDAVQISATTINGLVQFKTSFFFISTHLHQLKEIEAIKQNHVDTYFVNCNIYNETPVFSYEIKKGWSDLKIGQILFEKEGLNDLLRIK